MNNEEQQVIPQIIIFDGVDKVGKTTMKALFDKATKFFHWTIDRGPLSHLVYNIVYNRQGQNQAVGNITHIMSHAIIVYMTADQSILEKRIAESVNEPKIDLNRDLPLFETVLDTTLHLWKGGIRLDTSVMNPEATLHDMLNKLKKIEEVMVR
jgi:hypothetical protein